MRRQPRSTGCSALVCERSPRPAWRPLPPQFAEATEQVLSSVGGHGGGSDGGTGGGGGRHLAHLFSMPWRAATDSSAAERSRLRSYVENFLRMEFLPAVYVDYRWVMQLTSAWMLGNWGLGEERHLHAACTYSLERTEMWSAKQAGAAARA